jgi:hypothetical protein
VPGTLRDRVTKLLASGVLEENVGIRLDLDRRASCSAAIRRMVEDSRALLTARGFRVARAAAMPGTPRGGELLVRAREDPADIVAASSIAPRRAAVGRAFPTRAS